MGRSSATLPSAATRPVTSRQAPEPRPKEGHRDTVEAIVVAFILALVVRGFEAQAFVIPTGSMAPTLMGRHKEVACPQCGFVYAVNASEEVEPRSRSRRRRALGPLRQLPVPGTRSRDDAELQGGPHPGDDVPLRPAVPARQRAARALGRRGLPLSRRSRRSATSSGWSGSPARRSGSRTATSTSSRPGGGDFALARKPLRHQSAMQITVYDDRYRPTALAGMPEWTRWRRRLGLEPRPASPGAAIGRKPRATPGPSCAITTSCPIPSSGTPSSTAASCPVRPARPSITDFYSYNTNLPAKYSDLLGESQLRSARRVDAAALGRRPDAANRSSR